MNPSPTTEIERTLAKFRHRLRLLVLAAGVFQFLAVLAAAAWFSFAVDYLFEPPVAFRILFGGAILCGLFASVARLIVSRALFPMPLSSVALAIERRFPQFADRLMTAVELSDSPHPYSARLVEQSSRQAAKQLKELPIGSVLGRKPVALAALAGLVLTISTIAIATRSELTHYWRRRAILLEEVYYPRDTALSVIGFGSSRSKKVAVGRDFEVIVEADPNGVVPDRVRLQYWLTQSGGSDSAYMIKTGENRYRHQWRSVLEPMEFRVIGGDARTETYTLEAVAPPRITAVTADASYPPHTGMSDRTLPVGGAPLSVPVGTRLDFRIETDKPLEWLRVADDAALSRTDAPDAAERLAVRDNQRFTVDVWEPIRLQATLKDADGIGLQQPFPIDVLAVPDQPPKVTAVLNGVREEVTAQATLPIVATIADDYGIGELRFELQINDEPVQKETLDVTVGERPIDLTFAVEPLERQEGDELQLSVVADDNDALGGPKEGRAPPFSFRIVTAEQLLASIAAVELNLRQRFEQTLRELEETRRELDRLPALLEQDSDPAAGTARLSSERLLQSLRKNANESAAVTRGFEDVVAELRNNKVGLSAMFERLEQGVIAPLVDIDEMFYPQAVARLIDLRESLGDESLADELASAQTSLDRLIDRCKLALNAMRKLESYNEAIAMLQSVLDAQKELLEETKSERRRAILDLLK